MLSAALAYAAAIQTYARCLREHGATVDGPNENFTLGIGGPDADTAMTACPGPKPSLAGGFDADEMWSALHPPGAEPARTPVAYPTNADGLTYGSLADVPGGKLHIEDQPDLVSVATNEGGTGYVYAYELEGGPQAWVTNPEEAVQYMKNLHSRTLTAYATDGVTKVGTFTVGGEGPG